MDLFSAPNWYDQLYLVGTHLFVPGVGHYGIFNGSRWRRLILPDVTRFIRAQDTRLAAAG